jgi:hypothetical protein
MAPQPLGFLWGEGVWIETTPYQRITLWPLSPSGPFK